MRGLDGQRTLCFPSAVTDEGKSADGRRVRGERIKSEWDRKGVNNVKKGRKGEREKGREGKMGKLLGAKEDPGLLV